MPQNQDKKARSCVGDRSGRSDSSSRGNKGTETRRWEWPPDGCAGEVKAEEMSGGLQVGDGTMPTWLLG